VAGAGQARAGGRSAGRSAARTAAAEPTAPRNEVLLVGRLSAAPAERELPSGDVLLSWRVVVDRPAEPGGATERSGDRRTAVDALECVAKAAGVRRVAASWQVGDVVQVEGALRRRFWRGPGGLASRHEVEVRAARRLQRAS